MIFNQPPVTKLSGWLRCAAALAALACIAAVGDGAQAAGDYPQQPIRILVPYGPGGAGDLTIRLLTNKLSQNLKQPFVIENRPGAGGIAAMRAVLSSPADGYTLGEMGNGQAISMSLFQGLPYGILKDFTQISVAASFALLLAVPPTSPYKTVKDVIDAARKAPGKLNLGAINPGSTQNLSAHLFQQVSDAKFVIVTYRTTPDLVTSDSIISPGSKARSRPTSCASSPPRARSATRCSRTCRRCGKAECRITWCRAGTGSGRRPAFPPRSSTRSAPKSGRPWSRPTSRSACCGLGCRRAAARPRKCATGWPKTSPDGTMLSRRREFPNTEHAARHNLRGAYAEGGTSMIRLRSVTLLLGIVAASTGLPARLSAQAPVDPNGAPNPYRLDTNWLKIPEGGRIGQVTGVDIDPDGKSIWVFDRCGAKDCVNSPLNPIGKFDAGGNFVTGFGQGLFNHP